jgi:hypothetical protein
MSVCDNLRFNLWLTQQAAYNTKITVRGSKIQYVARRLTADQKASARMNIAELQAQIVQCDTLGKK